MIGAVVLIACAATVYGLVGRGPTVVQPIAFNHAIHVGQASLPCLHCHTDAETNRDAGLPRKQVCLDCHDPDQEEGQHPEKDKLFALAEGDEEVPWIRVAVTRPDVFFPHRRHVKTANLDCLECHTDQPNLAAPPSRARLVMSMATCIRCHERNATSTDCLVCHR